MAEEFYNISANEAVSRLGSSENGLSQESARSRLIEYGYNMIEGKKKISGLKIFLSQFSGFLIYILFAAVAVSFILGEYIDAIAIFVILLINGILGFVQEFRAEKSIDALRQLSPTNTTVIRDGRKMQIDSKLVVPGDIIYISSGEKICSDARLIDTFLFQVDESALTGESVPVKKVHARLAGAESLADRVNMVYSGTHCVAGNAKALCVATGMKTELGRIAESISEQEEVLTPLQKDLDNVGRFIGYFVLVICLIIFVFGLLDDARAIGMFNAGDWIGFLEQARDLFLTSVALAVAAVPEGLAIVVTIALAIGVKAMVRKNALIRKLPAIETLGCTTTICSDKTGTLTYNQMTVKRIYAGGRQVEVTGDGYSAEGVFKSDGKKYNPKKIAMILKAGCLNNNAEIQDGRVVGDPTEGCLIVSCEKAGFKKHMLESMFRRLKEIPFDSHRKMMSTLHTAKDGKVMFTKGAPDSVLDRCDTILLGSRVVRLTHKHRKMILEKDTEYAGQALRVLGFAYKDIDHDNEFSERKLTFLGLQAMMDPPRREVKDSIARCHKAGIRVIMITGDNALTASAIGREIGIHGRTVSGEDIDKINLRKEIGGISIFARVTPEHKMKIVEVLQERGDVVAMTGDGVNDAPALKHADIGIAMGVSGTDVAKEASKMVLLDDNFTTIVNAVQYGRGIYANIKKFVNYMFSCNFGELLVIFIAIVAGFQSPDGGVLLPFTALQILWMNLVTDSIPALALAMDPVDSKVMESSPRRKNAKLIDRGMMVNIIFIGFISCLSVLAIFKWGLDSQDSLTAQTLALTMMVMLEFVFIQVIRRQYNLGWFSNKWLSLSLALVMALHLAMVYMEQIAGWLGLSISNPLKLVPLSLEMWAVLVGMLAIVYVISRLFERGVAMMAPE